MWIDQFNLSRFGDDLSPKDASGAKRRCCRCCCVVIAMLEVLPYQDVHDTRAYKRIFGLPPCAGSCLIGVDLELL
jgi:hypothetical protein